MVAMSCVRVVLHDLVLEIKQDPIPVVHVCVTICTTMRTESASVARHVQFVKGASVYAKIHTTMRMESALSVRHVQFVQEAFLQSLKRATDS